MSLSNPLAWFAICALCLLIGAALSHTSAFYRQRQEEASASRFAEVDGLRGFLALGVFGAHAVNMYTLHTMDVWAAGIAPFYVLTARAGVALFFMITGFLFWLRVLRSEGRLDSRALFVSRLRRLTPMYAMSVLMALAVIAAASGFVPHSGLAELARELRPKSCQGAEVDEPHDDAPGGKMEERVGRGERGPSRGQRAHLPRRRVEEERPGLTPRDPLSHQRKALPSQRMK